MGFSNEDRILMKICTFLKVMEQSKLINEFPNEGWALWVLNKLLKRL